jgi:uncharacterized phiE125 gp8 family phage protein
MTWPPGCGCRTSIDGGSSGSAWDAGITFKTIRTVHPTTPILDLAYVRDKVLRVVNGTVEDTHIESLIREATEVGEEYTQRAFMPQTWQMVLTGFPSGAIELERPPLLGVTAFDYVDADGVTQSLAVSPADFQLAVSGKYAKASILPLVGASWPTTGTVRDAVTITYDAGYADVTDPQLARYARGVAVMVAELYKQRELTVQGTSVVPAALNLASFWERVY